MRLEKVFNPACQPDPQEVANVREEVLAIARDLHRLRLVDGTAGNVSARLGDETVCVTPSGLSYDEMTVDDLVVVDVTGAVVSGRRPPSSELALHLACYRTFPEVGGVVHSHPAEASVFAAARRPIPRRWTSSRSTSAARFP